MSVTSNQIQDLLGLVKSRFPNWSDFPNERLIKEELAYKRVVCAKATDLISDKEMRTLLDERRFEENLAQKIIATNDQRFPPLAKEVRKQSVLSHEDLAPKLGISFSTIARWENGKPKPSKLAKAEFDSFCAKMVSQGKLDLCWSKE